MQSHRSAVLLRGTSVTFSDLLNICGWPLPLLFYLISPWHGMMHGAAASPASEPSQVGTNLSNAAEELAHGLCKEESFKDRPGNGNF